jgi:hypothetical protein
MVCCVDFRGLNQRSIVDSHPLPNIEDNLSRLSRSCVFSTLDGAGAYHVVPIKKQDREKTAFGTPWGSYQCKRIIFGLCNAPGTYCRLVQMVVIDQKRIFLFRPKTNIRQENAAEYSADNEYSAKEENIAQKEKKLKSCFSGFFRKLQIVKIYTQHQKHTAEKQIKSAASSLSRKYLAQK